MINLDKTSISLNQNNLNRIIFSIHMNGNMSAAQIQSSIRHAFGLSFEQAPSTTYIENVIHHPKTLKKAQQALLNIDQLVAPYVKNIAGDELCSHPQYIFYNSCVPYSGYNLNLNAFSDHDRGRKNTWDDCYKTLKNFGLNPFTTTSDQAPGTMAGHKSTFKNATHIADFFHLYDNFKNLLKKARSQQAKLYTEWQQLYNIRTENDPPKKSKTPSLTERLADYYQHQNESNNLALYNDYNCMAMAPDLYKEYLKIEQNLKTMARIIENIQTLLGWFTGYILTLAGDNIKDRVELYLFIAKSLKECAQLDMTQKCLEVANTMERQIEKLLNFLPYLDHHFEQIAEQHNQHNNITQLTTEHLWKINKFLHYKPKDTLEHNLIEKTCNSNICALDLKNELTQEIGEPLFTKLVAQVHSIHQNTVTCSSFIENNIGRIKPFLIKGNIKITQERLDLLRLFINTSPIHSSRDYSKRSKTPLQLMMGDEHNIQWIDFLFDKPVIRQRGLKHPQVANQRTLPKAA